MSFLLKEELLQHQSNWKKTQIRLTPTLDNAINSYAESNELSFNSAMLELINEGLLSSEDKTMNPHKKIGGFEVFVPPYEDKDTLDTRYFNNKSFRELILKANEYIKDYISYEPINIEACYSQNSEGNQILTSLKVWFQYIKNQ